jgi:transcription elongation factor Elf1
MEMAANGPLSGAKGERMTQAYDFNFACPHCGQSGEVVWEGLGVERGLVRLSNGFHVEVGRLPGAKHVIICDVCDEIDAPRISK